ncbi:transposase [Methylomarinovum caldicuralii]|uniref:Transposase n=1 Tax=Methylomarinovum caldicuralii TaxID=438856 RepID=A0AAU9BZK9_9GAMM|nr:transposase [Methylomarinovum caldicuralii]
MLEKPLALSEVFVSIPDPRQSSKVTYDLVEVLVVVVCAVICGADTLVEIELWGKEKLDWLRRYVPLPHGIPSHDTLGRILAMIDPEAFGSAFQRWAVSVVPALEGQVIAIDGKTSRRSRSKGQDPLHLVSAFAAQYRLVVGQEAVADKSNEKTAIPALLETLALKGCVVTLDAMGTDPKIAKAIRDRGADYVLAVKDNQQGLAESIRDFFQAFQDAPKPRISNARRSTRRMVAWKCAAAMCSTSSTAWTGPSAGRIWPALPWSSPNAPSPAKPPGNGVSTSAACRPMPNGWPRRCASIGRWRTRFTGVWMSYSTMIRCAFEPDMRLITWRCSNRWCSISFASTPPNAAGASRQGGSWPPPVTTIGLSCLDGRSVHAIALAWWRAERKIPARSCKIAQFPERCRSWPNGPDSKSGVRASAPRVRIPPSPPLHENAGSLKPAFLCPESRRSGPSGPCNRTSASPRHPAILPLWLSHGPIFSATTPRKRTPSSAVVTLGPVREINRLQWSVW